MKTPPLEAGKSKCVVKFDLQADSLCGNVNTASWWVCVVLLVCVVMLTLQAGEFVWYC